MDGGVWKAAVRGVTKSRTRLSIFTFTFHFHALEKEMATHSSVLAWGIPGKGELGGLLTMGSHRVRHDWSDLAVAYLYKLTYIFYKYKILYFSKKLSANIMCKIHSCFMCGYILFISLWILFMIISQCIYSIVFWWAYRLFLFIIKNNRLNIPVHPSLCTCLRFSLRFFHKECNLKNHHFKYY